MDAKKELENMKSRIAARKSGGRIVILLRRDPNTVGPDLRQAFEAKVGGKVEFIRTDPVDYVEHLGDCQRLHPVAILLPTEKPITSAAMEQGFPHVIVTPRCELLELEPFVSTFVPFVART